MEQIETGSFAARELARSSGELRVVSWNIARGTNFDAVLAFLMTARAEIIFLQESDWNARRTKRRNVAKEMSQALRMNYVFGWEFEELGQGSASSPAYHGQATLSRWPLLHSRILRFQKQSNFWRPHWLIPPLEQFQRRLGGRMALVTEVEIPEGMLVTYNLHLESKGGDDIRVDQIRELVEDTRSYGPDTPLIAAGDFNLNISQAVPAAVLHDMGFVNPFGALHQPTAISNSRLAHGCSIDSILTRGPLVGINPAIHESITASDHYPLSLTLELCGSINARSDSRTDGDRATPVERRSQT